GDGTFVLEEESPAGGQPVDLALGDLDGDGLPDLLVADNGASKVTILKGDGHGGFRTKLGSVRTEKYPHAVALGNLNGDAFPDFAVASADKGTAGALGVWFGRGDGSFEAGPVFSAGLQPTDVAISDLNGD